MQPHRSRTWLHPEIEDGVVCAAEAGLICELYQQAPALDEAGTHRRWVIACVCCDEKTGRQALERKPPTRPMRPGLVERREFESGLDLSPIRHGTQCLFANFEGATGRVLAPSMGPTRTEADFARHIAQTIETDAEARWIFVVDRLNTHCSETLVRWVAQHCGIQADLGAKGKRGLLASRATRSAFLSSREHRIRFVYTPKPGRDSAPFVAQSG